jgi:asparagine synthase (glutamine-hydrolysing)
MCGVLGMVAAPSRKDAIPRERFQRALDVLKHRGPDGQGQYQDGHVWLGHTRLSILDLSSAGKQPMQSPDGRFVISYNGEVYNFRELATAHGLNNLRSGSDTEVVLQLFADHGVASLVELNGIRPDAFWTARSVQFSVEDTEFHDLGE